MSHAKTSRKQDAEPDYPESAQDSGIQWLESFARFDPDTSSSKTSRDLRPRWVAVQENLLSPPSSPIWPKQGMWDLGYAYALPTSERPTVESGSSCLLPTPAATDDGKSPEAHLAMKAKLPGGVRKTITSLAVLARSGFKQPLLPTPSANDSTGAESETRKQRQQEGRTGGPSLRDITHLLPTPTAGTPEGGSRNLPGSKAHVGVSLMDAIIAGDSKTPRTGEPMNPPSADGNTPSEDERPEQLMIDDA